MARGCGPVRASSDDVTTRCALVGSARKPEAVGAPARSRHHVAPRRIAEPNSWTTAGRTPLNRDRHSNSFTGSLAGPREVQLPPSGSGESLRKVGAAVIKAAWRCNTVQFGTAPPTHTGNFGHGHYGSRRVQAADPANRARLAGSGTTEKAVERRRCHRRRSPAETAKHQGSYQAHSPRQEAGETVISGRFRPDSHSVPDCTVRRWPVVAIMWWARGQVHERHARRTFAISAEVPSIAVARFTRSCAHECQVLLERR